MTNLYFEDYSKDQGQMRRLVYTNSFFYTIEIIDSKEV